jgi:NifU-like protein involved in Fe-S cluster formation
VTTDPDTFEAHLSSSAHCGQPARWTHHAEAINPLCGDRVALWLEIRDETIVNARFTSTGCAVSRVGASLLCERIAGQPLIASQSMTDRELLESAGIDLSPTRRQCLLLTMQALRNLRPAEQVNAAP